MIIKLNIEKKFDFLLEHGFKKTKVKANIKKYTTIIYIKNHISIKIQLDNKYQINFNYDIQPEEYIDFYSSNIGTKEDRNKLYQIMMKYANLHPIDKSEGVLIDTVTPHVLFIKKNLDQF
jgi:hypothetical protein